MIEAYTPRAQSEVIALANRVFGEGYFRATTAIGNESGSLMLLWRGSEGELAGFVPGRRLLTDGSSICRPTSTRPMPRAPWG